MKYKIREDPTAPNAVVFVAEDGTEMFLTRQEITGVLMTGGKAALRMVLNQKMKAIVEQNKQKKVVDAFLLKMKDVFF